ncbi:MAG: DUF4111 domain-containing protein [bacterium]|nr:DUF4111 domain-containing protein [bacterium]
MGYNYYNAPKEVKGLLEKIVLSYSGILKDNLVGIYLHGSLALGCFNPYKSDIDFLVVVKDKLSMITKKEVVNVTLNLAELKETPPKGLEFSIVLEKYLKNFTHPMPFEFHYSKTWHNAYKEGKIDLEKEDKDRDLAAHITVIFNRGICLYGKPIEEVFYPMPKEYYIDALLYDVEDMDKNIHKDPVYGVLNLCRVLCFLEEERIISKEEGGLWGINNLPMEYRHLPWKALKEYGGEECGNKWNTEELLDFLDYMVSRINRLINC